MFWLGFVAGIAATFVALFVWLTRSGDVSRAISDGLRPIDNSADEHSEALGIGAADTHFGSVSK